MVAKLLRQKNMAANQCLQSNERSSVNRCLFSRSISAAWINGLLAGLLILFSPWSTAEPTAEASSQSLAVKFYVEDIKSTMEAYVASKIDADDIFYLKDDRTGENLALKFVMVHDPVRQIRGDIYFACTDFPFRTALRHGSRFFKIRATQDSAKTRSNLAKASSNLARWQALRRF